MKSKTAEALAVAYHRWRIELIGIFSPKSAALAAYRIFTVPPPPSRPIPDPQLPEAEPISFPFKDFLIRGFCWQPKVPNGKKIILAHGFRSYALKFEHLAKALLEKGFTIYAFDAPVHGRSGGQKIEAVTYRDMILEADRLFGPFYAGIGHSLGGLSMALASERFPDVPPRKVVFIAPATETSRSIADLFRIIPVRNAIREAFNDLVHEFAGVPVSHFSVNRVVQSSRHSILWIHDEDDKICPLEDLRPSLDLSPKRVEFLITKGLGHNQVYRDPTVINQLVTFINNPEI